MVGEAGQRVGHCVHRDVRVRPRQADDVSVFIPHCRPTADHPPIGAVLVAQAVTEAELGWSVGPRGLYLAQHPGEIFGMDSLEPLLRRVADFVVFMADQGNPARREMNPVRYQIPVPQSVTLDVSPRMVLIHTRVSFFRPRLRRARSKTAIGPKKFEQRGRESPDSYRLRPAWRLGLPMQANDSVRSKRSTY